MNFFMVYDINIHELNLRPCRDLKFLDELSFKILLFSFLNNKCINISFLRKKPPSHKKDFIDGKCNFFQFSFVW